jgi:hypothetical protein
LLSDDAHSAGQLGNKFNETRLMAQECGIKNFYGNRIGKMDLFLLPDIQQNR